MSRRASGLRAWVLQRITAVYIGLFLLLLLAIFLFSPPQDHASWRAWVAQPLVSIAFVLLIASLVLHAWVGVRDIVIDYVHPLGWRILILALAAVYILASAAWALLALARLT